MARETLKQRIALDGGKEIEAELKALGKAGEEAFKQLKDAAGKAGRSGNKLGVAVAKLKVGVDSLKTAGDRLNSTFRSIGTTAGRMRAWLSTVAKRMTAITVAALAAAAAIKAIATAGAKSTAETGRAAEGLGADIEDLSRLEFAAKLSGLGVEKLRTALGNLNQRLGEASKKSKTLTGDLEQTGFAARSFGEATDLGARATAFAARQMKESGDEVDNFAKAIKDLGLNLGDLKALGAVASMEKIASAFKRFPDGPDKARVSAALFGQSVRDDMIPFLNQGGKVLDDFGKKSDKIGATLTEEANRIAIAYLEAQATLSETIKGLRDDIGRLFQPALTAAMNKQVEALTDHRKAIIDFASGGVKSAIALYQELAFALSSKRRRGIKLSPLAESLLAARKAIMEFAADVKVAWDGIIQPAFEGLLKIFDEIALGINAAFGTDFTGRQVAIAAFVGVLVGVFSSFQALLLGIAALVVGFAPEVIPMLTELAGTLATLFGPLKDQLVQIPGLVQEVVAAFSGRQHRLERQSPLTMQVKEWILLIEEFGAKLKSIWEKILEPTLSGIAASINLIAGTDLTGMDVLLLLILGKFTGVWLMVQRIVTSLAAVVFIFNSIVGFGKLLFTLLRGIGAFLLRFLVAPLLTLAGALLTIAATFLGLPVLLVGAIAAAVILAGALIFSFWDEIEAGGKAAWAAVSDFSAEAVRRIGVLWEALPGILKMVWDDIASGIKDIWGGAIDFIISKFNSLVAAAKKAFAAITKTNKAASAGVVLGGGGSGFARGGAVVGPGTATSDSIPARLSRGEFVIRAAAVDRYGPRLFAALNSMRVPKAAVPGFSLGGLVAALGPKRQPKVAVPAFSLGGLVAVLARSLSSQAPAPALASTGGGAVPAVVAQGAMHMPKPAVPRFNLGGLVDGLTRSLSSLVPLRAPAVAFAGDVAVPGFSLGGLVRAVNVMRMPQAVPGFSLGGLVEGVTNSLSSLVPMPTPALAFAGGGAVPAVAGPSGRPVTIVLDGERFKLNAEDAVAESLTRSALGQQRRQAGRQPYWFGG